MAVYDSILGAPRAAPMDKVMGYPLTNLMGVEDVIIPKGSEFLAMAVNDNQISMWFLITPDSIEQNARFHKYLTLQDILASAVYRGTAILNGRTLHVFQDL